MNIPQVDGLSTDPQVLGCHRGPPGWPKMWWRGRNGANLGMVPPQGRGSDNRSRTHGRDALSGGGGSKSKHGGDGGNRARVGVAGRGRRRLPHSG